MVKAHVSRDIPWTTALYIHGRRVRGEGEEIRVADPATEEILATVGGATGGQIEEAIAAARSAFESGYSRAPHERRRMLLALADLMERDRDELTRMVVSEVGTPVALCASLQVAEPIAVLRHFADLALVDRTRYLGPADGPPRSDAFIRYEPSGVVAAVTAYNYPLLFAAVKLGAALAAGCTVVLLPSFQAPLATLHLGQLCLEAGFPPGVVNVLAGDAAAARALTSHPGINKISFTGSADVGRKIMAQAAPRLTRLVLELGGKSPSILLPSADIEQITSAVHARYLRNSGQGCSAPTRILVHRTRYPEFLELTRSAVDAITVGDPWDPATVAGPLISAAHRARVEGHVGRALDAGGRLVAGGGRPGMPRGWYMNPAVITDVPAQSEIARTELFGPVGLVFAYDTIEHAVVLANDSEYGLSATVYGDVDEARSIVPRLRVGTVMINGWVGRRDQSSGGFKASGFGREAGEDGVREFLETQFVAWPVQLGQRR